MGFHSVTARRMVRSADDKRDILRRFMNERKLKAGPWAKRAGVSANSIYNFLNGHSEALDLLTYAKLARVENVAASSLSGEQLEPPSPTALWVAGHVEAGAFREAVEWDRALWYAVDVPVPNRFRRVAKALEVRGPSMNLEYPEGSVVVWVDFLDARPPANGDHVIVYAYAADDSLEATVKELRIVNGKRWLWPRSDSPEHQLPVDVDNPGASIRRIELQGLVLGGYKQRVI